MRDEALPFVDIGGFAKPTSNALAQLLLKSVSTDKKFVLEAAQKVLRTCVHCLDPAQVLEKALPYGKHKCAPFFGDLQGVHEYRAAVRKSV